MIATGGAITRDVWTGVPGTAVASIPLATPPTSTGTISSLEVPQSAPDQDNYGARIRGYITAPMTGIYKFWLTGSDTAELYIADDDEPVNAFKRAEVTAPTGFREWTNVNAGQVAAAPALRGPALLRRSPPQGGRRRRIMSASAG